MKSKIIFLSIFLAGMFASLQAQESSAKKEEIKKEKKEKSPEKTMKEFPVYPGCKNHENDNEMLLKCFLIKFDDDFSKNLDPRYPENADKNKDFLAVKFGFVVKSDGTIGGATILGGDKEIYDQVLKSVERLSHYLQENNKYIRPAVNELGDVMEAKFVQQVKIRNPFKQKQKTVDSL